MRWSIDAADAYSVAKVRRAVVEQLKNLTGQGADLYAVETVLGELLGAEMERGHLAVAIIIERAVGGPAVHIYTQGEPAVSGSPGEIAWRDLDRHGPPDGHGIHQSRYAHQFACAGDTRRSQEITGRPIPIVPIR